MTTPLSDANKKAELASKVTYLPDIHRMLPQAPDAEQGVLSSLLLAPIEVSMLCAQYHVQPKWFHIPSHAEIYSAIQALLEDAQPVDFIKVSTYLRDRNKLDAVGGAAFLSTLYTFLPTASNARYYLEILSEKWILREMIRVCTEYAAVSYDEQDNVMSLLDRAETEMLAIRPQENRTKKSNKELVMECISDLQAMYESRGAVTGLTTGFPQLDRMLDGLQPAELIIIAARPSYGKTAFAMRIAEHVAIERGDHVGVFSLEMSSKQLIKRLINSMARVDFAAVRDGRMSERDFPAITAAAAKCAAMPVHFDDTEALSIQDFRAKARRLHQVHKVKAIFVDYLQLMRSTSKRAQENRQLEVAEISAGLKATAKELHIPVVALAQIGRGIEQRGIHARPRLADLRESGSIEQDADVIGFIDQPGKRAETDDEREFWRGKAELIIAKNRSGPCGTIPLTFMEQFTRFEIRADVYEEEPPQQELSY